MSDERKWKHGDIGPDGRVFWAYRKSCKNGEQWLTKDRFDEEKAKQKAYQQTPEYKTKKKAYQQAPKSKAKQKAYQQTPKRRDYLNAHQRSVGLKKSFRKRDGSSLGAFLDSSIHLDKTLSAIMDLITPEGKTLSEMIYDLSGYDMSVCEEIANLCKGEFPDA